MRFPSLFMLFNQYINIGKKILVIGTGSDIANNLKHNTNDKVVTIQSLMHIKRHKNASSIIIAVNTSIINGKCNDEFIIDALCEIGRQFNEPMPILITSNVTHDLVNKYPSCVTISPTTTAADTLVLGGDKDASKYWAKVFSYAGDPVYVSRTVAALMGQLDMQTITETIMHKLLPESQLASATDVATAIRKLLYKDCNANQ